MTTPGGVPNLPVGALTLDNLASNLQDMSGAAMKSRAVERFPSIMDSSTGLSPALDVTPFGILTRIWSEVNSLVANADPADIQGPEDLPPLLLEFIEGIPVVGQFVELIEAILGTYDGEDGTLLAIQSLFAPIRKLLQLITGTTNGFPTPESIVAGWTEFASAAADVINTFIGVLTGSGTPNGDLSSLGFLFTAQQQTIGALKAAVAQLQQQLQAGFARVDGRFDAIQSSLTVGATTSGFDNFNRTTGIGTDWTAFPGVPLIEIFNGPFSGGYVQTNYRTAGYFNAHEPATDKHGVLIKVVNKSSGTCRALLSCNTDASNYAGIEVGAGVVGDDYVRMITGSSPTNVVAHDQANVTLNNDYVIDIRYDPDANAFIVLMNKNELFRWTDTTNIVTHGSSKRKCAIVSNGNNFSLFGFGMGFAITDFTFYDW